MQACLGALTILVLVVMVLGRVAMLRRQGVRAMNFGKQDKTDFIIPPFAFFYFYLVFANALVGRASRTGVSSCRRRLHGLGLRCARRV